MAADPITLGLAAVSIGSTIAGGVMQSSAAEHNAQAAADAAKYKEAVARNEAASAIMVGQAQESQQRMKTSALVASQRAAQGASGLDVNSGSLAAVRAGTQWIGEMDAQTIRDNARRRAAASLDQAELASMEASYAESGGELASSAALLSTVSSVAGKWYGLRKEGVGGNIDWWGKA